MGDAFGNNPFISLQVYSTRTKTKGNLLQDDVINVSKSSNEQTNPFIFDKQMHKSKFSLKENIYILSPQFAQCLTEDMAS